MDPIDYFIEYERSVADFKLQLIARKYGDPDIEKVTIVTGAKEAAGLIANYLATEAECEAPDNES